MYRAAAIAVSLVATVATARAADNTPLDTAAGGDRYVFSMSAASGTFSGETLTLKTVPVVVYFAERPQRTSGQMDLKAFVDLWSKGADSFKDDPPNAELSIHRAGGNTHSVLIVESPTVEGDAISFNVVILDDAIPSLFKNATLFIDGLGMIEPSGQN